MKIKNSFQGVGLIEVLISLLILSGCIISILKFQSVLTYNQNSAQQKIEANFLAEKKIAQLRDYQVLIGQPGYFSYADIVSGSTTVNGFNTVYTLTWTVTNFTNYKNVNCVVTWLDKYNVSNSVRLVTIISRLDPKDEASTMSR